MVDKLGRMIEFLIGNNPNDDIGSFRWERDKQNKVIYHKAKSMLGMIWL